MMKIVLLSPIVFLIFFNDTMQCAERGIPNQLCTISDVICVSQGTNRSLYNYVVTKIHLKGFDQCNFAYDFQYRCESDNGRTLKVEIPFCIPIKRNNDMELTIRAKESRMRIDNPSYQSYQYLLPSQIEVQEVGCHISNFDMLDDKIDQAVYAALYYVVLQGEPVGPADINQKLVMFVGKCPTKGHSIYKVYHEPTGDEKEIPNPFLLFSPELITMNNRKLKLNRKQSKISYFMPLSNLNVLIPDLKKQSMLQWMLTEYIRQNYTYQDIVYADINILKYIMSFVHQTYLIENKNMDRV